MAKKKKEDPSPEFSKDEINLLCVGRNSDTAAKFDENPWQRRETLAESAILTHRFTQFP